MEVSFEGAGFTISRAVVGPIDNNAYLIRSDATGAAIIVDAADDVAALTELASDADVERIITTHGHWDHHQAAVPLATQLGIKPELHPADASMVSDTFEAIEPGPFMIGDVAASAIHTPGHTPGSLCIALQGVVLTGDTLFPGGPGATRFDHSSFDDIIDSISQKLFTLGDETVVLPGHGAHTTIGNERGHLHEWIDRGW